MFDDMYNDDDEISKEELEKAFEEYKGFLVKLCYVLHRNNITINYQPDDSDAKY